MKRSLNQEGLIIVDKLGITDNSSIISHGLIEWNDIIDIYLKYSIIGSGHGPFIREHYNKFLIIKKKGGKKILIAFTGLKINPEQLMQNIIEYRKKTISIREKKK